jgi:MFS family permease
MSEVTASRRVGTEDHEFRRAWPVVLACFCVATYAWGFGFYGQSVFLAELHTSRGWPASLISSATTLYYLVAAVLLTRVHRALDILGPRLLLAGGAAIMGAGAIGMSRVAALWQLYLCNVVMATGWASTTTTAIALTLACWFDRRRGLAVSLALTGASAGGFIIAPLLVGVAHRIGLERAVLLIALGGLAILLPTLLIGIARAAATDRAGNAGRTKPRGVPGLTEFTGQAEALRSRHFWSVALPFALALAAQVGFIVHQTAILLPRLGPNGTAIALAATAIAAAVGRLSIAPVIDYLDQRIASAASFASQALGLCLIVLLPEQRNTLYLGSLLLGLSVGNVITLPALIVQREFAPGSFGLVLGLCSTVGHATLAFGPTLLGLARDITGTYDGAISLCILLQLTATVTIVARRWQA